MSLWVARLQSLLVSLVLLTTTSFALAQTTWYVDDDNCPGPGSGSLADPFCKIQDGIDVAVHGDTVLVLPGTYFESIDFRDKSVTVRSQDGPTLTTIKGGAPYTAVVTMAVSPGRQPILDGFTVTSADGVHSACGIVAQGSAIVQNNFVTGNFAGGVSSSGQATIRGNTIWRNQDLILAGGILCTDSSLVEDNVIACNGTGYGTGGVLCGDSTTVRHNIITLNSGGDGSAAAVTCVGSAVVSHNVIAWNEHSEAYGTVVCGGSPRLESNEITNNEGPAVHCSEGSTPLILNNIIAYSIADPDEYSGGIYCTGAAPVITNNTIYGNVAGVGAGIVCFDGSSPRVTNTIVWNNSESSEAEIWLLAEGRPSTLTISHSDVRGGVDGVDVGSGCTLNWGSGMIEAEPRFEERAIFHIRPYSPCRNAGDDNPVGGLPTEDFDGEPRVMLGIVDMGVDENFAMADAAPGAQKVGPRPWFVDAANQPGPGSGSAADPYNRIQYGINAAGPRDSVLVRPGTYFERINFLGKAITLRSDADGDPATHDPSPNTTIIDGEAVGTVVVFRQRESADSILEGFTITNGDADYGSHAFSGGGIQIGVDEWGLGASPTIRGNIIAANRATIGGGIYCEHSAARLEGNVIRQNVADSGGIACVDSTPTIAGNLIHDNEGGGIYCENSSAWIANNWIYRNHYLYEGGGIRCSSWPATTVTIVNNTLFDNSSGSSGGGIACGGQASATIENTVLWDNTAPDGDAMALTSSEASATIDFSDVEGGLSGVWVTPGAQLDWGGAMIDADPLFTDAAAGDLHLTSLSPCINRASNAESPANDIDGDLRPFMGTSDMGADEFVETHLLSADTFILSQATGGLVNLALDAGASEAGRTYVTFGSVTGTAPGTPLPGHLAVLPLNWDVFSNLVIKFLNTPVFQSFSGTLDPSGQAAAVFNTGGPLPPEAVGLALSFAYALNGPWNFVSNPVTIEVVP
ncbi:MAG: right-handed parallel beta-helix repeat-containing protein [Planctomycetota bacterium]